MARGGPVKRTHTVSVRLTPDERLVWDQARERTGRKELGAWVRDVVTETLDVSDRGAGQKGGPERTKTPTRVPGGARVVPEVNQDAYRQLVGVAGNLNQIARKLNAGGGLSLTELSQALEEVQLAARAVQGR